MCPDISVKIKLVWGGGGIWGATIFTPSFPALFLKFIFLSIFGFAHAGAPFWGNLFFVPDFVRRNKGVVGMDVGGNDENKRAPYFCPFSEAMAIGR